MFYYVTPTTQARAVKWHAIFGTDELPVLARQPRRQETRHGQQLAYDLAVSRLHPQAMARLAAYVSRETRRPYTETLAEVRGGWPLVADGLRVIDTAVSGDDRKRPFFGLWPVGQGVRL